GRDRVDDRRARGGDARRGRGAALRVRREAARRDPRPAPRARRGGLGPRGRLTDLLRLERAGAVEETPRGLRAALDGETLRLDVVRDDVVRVKISRAGAFDESPTHAVCADTESG